MKIVLLNGSARNNGNTNALVEMIAGSLDPGLFDHKVLNISDYRISYCLGCHACETGKKCIQDDDVEVIYGELKAADIICVASPSYWGYVTGQMKVFFDRSTPYCDAIDGIAAFPAGKKGAAVSLRAGSSRGENLEIVKSIEHYFSHLGIIPLSSSTFENIRKKSDLHTGEMKARIEKFAHELNHAAGGFP